VNAPTLPCSACGCPAGARGVQDGVKVDVLPDPPPRVSCACRCHYVARTEASLVAVHKDLDEGLAPEAAFTNASWPKECPFCERPITAAEWLQLQKVGYVGAFRASGKVYCTELRNHDCGSTLGIDVEVPMLKRRVAS